MSWLAEAWSEAFDSFYGPEPDYPQTAPLVYRCHRCDTEEKVGPDGPFRCWLCGSEDVERKRYMTSLASPSSGPDFNREGDN